MEWKVSREKLPVTEIILDEVQEQDFAQGLVLPDYDPEIFRVISCEAEPSVTGWQLQGNRLTYELCVELRVLYCGSESKAIHSVSQIMTYSKALDVPEHCGKEPMFWFHPRTDYQNCRAADKRRLDVRGAVSIRIRMGCESCEEVISGISGDDIQLKHRQISVPMFFAAAAGCVQEGSIIEISVQTPDGKNICTNMRVTADDLELMDAMKEMTNNNIK